MITRKYNYIRSTCSWQSFTSKIWYDSKTIILGKYLQNRAPCLSFLINEQNFQRNRHENSGSMIYRIIYVSAKWLQSSPFIFFLIKLKPGNNIRIEQTPTFATTNQSEKFLGSEFVIFEYLWYLKATLKSISCVEHDILPTNIIKFIFSAWFWKIKKKANIKKKTLT